MNNFKRQLSSIKRQSRIKECFCSSDQCSSSIIKAHSIQNNRILGKIAENGCVIQFKAMEVEGDFSIDSEKIGRKVATISTNFCSSHDTKIFLPIESKNYQRNNKEQEFLFAYRAFAREYHVKCESKNFYESAGQLNSGEYRDYFDLALKGTNNILEQMEKERIQFNNALNHSNFGIIGTYIIEFHGFYEIAASSSFAIEYDLKGNQINNLSDFSKELKITFLTVFPQGNKTFILISFYQKNKKIFSFINNQIMKRSINEQKVIISNLLLNYVENLVLSPRLWNLLIKKQDFIKQMSLRSIKTFENNLSNIQDVNLFV